MDKDSCSKDIVSQFLSSAQLLGNVSTGSGCEGSSRDKTRNRSQMALGESDFGICGQCEGASQVPIDTFRFVFKGCKGTHREEIVRDPFATKTSS